MPTFTVMFLLVPASSCIDDRLSNHEETVLSLDVLQPFSHVVRAASNATCVHALVSMHVSCRMRASTVPPPRPKDRSWTVETVGPSSVPRDACPGLVNSRLPSFVRVSRGGFGGGALRLTLG